jgi:hypothetical protein
MQKGQEEEEEGCPPLPLARCIKMPMLSINAYIK